MDPGCVVLHVNTAILRWKIKFHLLVCTEVPFMKKQPKTSITLGPNDRKFCYCLGMWHNFFISRFRRLPWIFSPNAISKKTDNFLLLYSQKFWFKGRFYWKSASSLFQELWFGHRIYLLKVTLMNTRHPKFPIECWLWNSGSGNLRSLKLTSLKNLSLEV